MKVAFAGLKKLKVRDTALLSQEGSTIETAVEIVRGVVPEWNSPMMHSETFRLGNHPSPAFTVTYYRQ